MKLTILHEQGHWQIMGGHPGYPGKKKKKRQMSFFVHPPKLKVKKIKYETREDIPDKPKWPTWYSMTKEAIPASGRADNMQYWM
ncbi:MAG: hypothetical protein GF411_14350 [Candidatus Lokiarchaeota archaeon]|nr:hypothetical protein [Candidatus Lokiarchaeota archaeon]